MSSDLAAILARRRAAVDNQDEAQYDSPPAASRASYSSPHVVSAARATEATPSEIPPKVTAIP